MSFSALASGLSCGYWIMTAMMHFARWMVDVARTLCVSARRRSRLLRTVANSQPQSEYMKMQRSRASVTKSRTIERSNFLLMETMPIRRLCKDLEE